MTLGRPGALLADRYRLDRLLGGNGSTERWQAYDERLARPVIARLTSAAGDAAREDAAQVMLERLARLNHPGVAAVYDVGTVDDLDAEAGTGGGPGVVGAVSYAISEWTDGRTLGQIMETGPQLWSRIADWGQQISGALAALHSLGIVHGALGPNSIAIHDDRQVKILDAGLGPMEDEAATGVGAGDGGGIGGAAARGDFGGDVERGAGGAGGAGGDDGDGYGDGASGRAGGTSGAESEGHVDVPVGAAEDVYALGRLLWEAAVGAAPAFVERDVDVAGGYGASGDGVPGGGVEGDGVSGRVAPGARGVDLQPLRVARVPSELAELLAEMLDGDPARRPTAAVAQQRFGPFAPVERVADTVPEVPLAASRTLAVLPTPQVGRTTTTTIGLGRGVGSTADLAAAAAAAAERESERRRRRGLFVGIVLLLAAIGTGVGLLVVNLKPSNGELPNGGNTGVPLSSPVPVTLPSLSPSPSPSLTTTSAAPATSSVPSKSPSPSPSASPSASHSPSASPSASVTSTGSAPASATSSSPASADPSGAGGGSASASPGGASKPAAGQPGA